MPVVGDPCYRSGHPRLSGGGASHRKGAEGDTPWLKHAPQPSSGHPQPPHFRSPQSRTARCSAQAPKSAWGASAVLVPSAHILPMSLQPPTTRASLAQCVHPLATARTPHSTPHPAQAHSHTPGSSTSGSHGAQERDPASIRSLSFSFLRFGLLIFRERGRGRESEGEKHEWITAS